jgi:perosamine synthetase
MEIPAARIHFSDDDRRAILERIDGILRSGALTLGPFGASFEAEFARTVGARHAIAVNSGTSAIEIVLRCWDVAGKKVVVPTNTFLATALAVWHAGAEVVFADAADDLCVDPAAIESAIDDRTAAVIVVHIGGAVTPHVERIRDACRARGVKLLEDAAHAHGARLNGRHAGTFGDAGTFSFYPTKIMTSGEGGMIVTEDAELDGRARVFRDQGKAGFLGNVHTELGYNWRLSEVHAAIGLTHLGRLDRFVADRRRIAQLYDRGLSSIAGVEPLLYPAGVDSSYYKYIALLDPGIDRAALKKRLRADFKVSLSGEVYELPVHVQPVVERMQGPGQGRFPRAEELCRRHICLPVYPEMREAEAEYVLESLRKAVS